MGLAADHLLGTMSARNPLPQPHTFLHRRHILRVEHPTVRTILRTSPNQLVHPHEEVHDVLDFAQTAGLVGCGTRAAIVEWEFQFQRV